MSLPIELLADFYDLYLCAAVEQRLITCLECDELRHLRRLFGIHLTDVEQIRQVLIVKN
jgi:hypothetical protein